VSFAYLVYSSAWLKLHYPAAFLAGCLNGQPFGFWSPQTLVADARRHGVTVLGVDVNLSSELATLAGDYAGKCGEFAQGVGAGGLAVRLGLEYVRTIGKELAEKIAAGRPYRDMEDVVRRNGLSTDQVEALATAGAFGCFDLERREALWSAGAVAQSRPGRLAGIVTGERAPDLPAMDAVEQAAADLWATGLSPDRSPTEFVRPWLDEQGAVTAAGLVHIEHGRRVTVGGVVTHRQRPATAQGVTFINLEDETGLINVICSKGTWARYRRVARSASALLVRGRVEKNEGVINIVADRIEALSLALAVKSRDFR